MDNTKKEIMKPVTLVVEDLQNDIIDRISKTPLPYFMIESVLEKILIAVQQKAAQQLEADRAQYDDAMKQVKTDECE